MKITLPITILFFVISFFIIRQLLKWNEDLSSGIAEKKIHACNWEPAEKCQEAVQYWRDDAERTSIVKKIVGLDFLYQCIYGNFLAFALQTQSRKPQPEWLRKWLRIGIPFIIVFALIAIFQGATIYRLVSDLDSETFDRRLLTKIKWVLCAIGVIPLLLSLFPFKAQNARQ